MCGSCTSGEDRHPTTEVYLDKFVKFIFSPVLFCLGVIGLVMLFLVDKIKCFGYPASSLSTRISQVEEFCWIDFTEAVNYSKTWYPENRLPHKLFPILIITEAASVLLPIILWYWCYGRGISDDVSSLLDHVNSLTNAYSRYDRGSHVTVANALHNQLDNYLQFFIYCLTSRARPTFISFIVKWACLVFILCGWIVGLVLIHKNFGFKIFRDKFSCLYSTTTSGIQNIATCTIPTSTYMRAVWFINLVVIVLLAITTVAYIIDLSRPKLYEKCFLYNSVPGCMDRRLAVCARKFFNSQQVSLFAKFCEMNSHILCDIGRSKTLARKYALLEGISPGRETVVDIHYPVIQPYQLDKFVVDSELYYLNIQSQTSKKKESEEKKDKTENKKPNKKSKKTDKRKRKIKPNTSKNPKKLLYVSPRFLDRSFYKYANESPRGRLNESPITQRSNQTRLTLEDLDFSTSTPVNWGESRQGFISPLLQSSRGQGKSTPNVSNIYSINNIRRVHPAPQRQLDPYAYRLYTSLLRRKAENLGKWKP